MIDDVELLDESLEGGSIIDSRVRDLVALARDLSRALAAQQLSEDVRERIRGRVLGSRRRTLPVPIDALRRQPATLLGGAAITIAAAALGVAVLRSRRQHASAAA